MTTDTPPATDRQVTDALHSILRSHLQTTHAPRAGAFNATPTQRNAELAQALQRAQRNL